jgi:hypothetical protein
MRLTFRSTQFCVCQSSERLCSIALARSFFVATDIRITRFALPEAKISKVVSMRVNISAGH